MDELRRIIGTEVPLDRFHLSLRQLAAQASGVGSYGSCLVTCSDERQGILRASFERDVAGPLITDVANARDRVFSVSNLCGRLEPGAFALIDNHFTRRVSRGRKLLVIEIASHVGRVRRDRVDSYGRVERFGRVSPCCGALTTLLEPREETGTVRHPWFEQLNSFFGPVRLNALRQLETSHRMIAAAIIHAALQAESALAEVLQEVPDTPTDVLLVAGVSVNQQWADGFLPVAYHHVRIDDGAASILGGYSLRTTPEALDIDLSGARIKVASGATMEQASKVARRLGDEDSPDPELEAAVAGLRSLSPEHRAILESRLTDLRRQTESIRSDPEAWRTYARPVLRGLFRGLSVVQPEVGVAALLFDGGEKLLATRKLQQLVRNGPGSAEGRRVLHDIEAELQQLNHEDAQQVLDLLLAESHH